MTKLYVFFISMIILSIILYVGFWKYFGNNKNDHLQGIDPEISFTIPNCEKGDFALILKNKSQTIESYICGENETWDYKEP